MDNDAMGHGIWDEDMMRTMYSGQQIWGVGHLGTKVSVAVIMACRHIDQITICKQKYQQTTNGKHLVHIARNWQSSRTTKFVEETHTLL